MESFLLVVLGVLVVVLIVIWAKNTSNVSAARVAKERAEQVQAASAQQLREAAAAHLVMQQKVNELFPYQAIVDTQAECKRLAEEAGAERQQVLEEAKATKSQSKSEATALLSHAHDEAERLIAKANADAKSIAGSAWEAKEQAEHYRETVRAMKNVIKGYGDEYLVPNHTVLDELAKEFSHKDAGQKLKLALTQTRQMVKEGRAAECDYKESVRRTTAICFVLDAFNGKVEVALSKVKLNNFGKLKQEILDARRLVDENGTAFRNARILPPYVDARLDELKWAVASNELKLIEKEEQRAIKADMREEEKARRDIEKAMKDAQREERMLEKAMAKARAELAKASDEQKSKYEEQIRELEQKWQEAEAKNQRAMSMAQQTRRGHVYVISNIGSFGENVFKIGLTRRLEPLDRVKELGDASVPFEFDVHAMIFAEDAPTLEKSLHKQFRMMQVNRVNPRKEFFRISLGTIREYLESQAIEAHWTMAAEAAQYRESVAMERHGQAAALGSAPPSVPVMA
tara:strand:- start:58145 stop:59692 length:1548 start_codon:yes stop_codon:yes gene_type:complete